MPPSRGRAALGRFSPFEPVLEVLGDDFVERRLWRKGNVAKRQEAATGGHGGDGHATLGCCDANHATRKPRSHDTARMTRHG